MKVENGFFRPREPYTGNPPTHGVYNQHIWQLMGSDAVAVSLHHDFDSAVAAAARWELNGASCTVVCYQHNWPVFQILHLEDDQDDRSMVEREIVRHWKEAQIQWVNSARMFAATLADPSVSLVLCDHGGPDFDGREALTLARIIRPEVAFVFLTGAPEPHLKALEMAGADGVLSKKQLPRLKEVVDAAMESRKRRCQS